MNEHDHDRRRASLRIARGPIGLSIAVLCASLTFGAPLAQANLAPPNPKVQRRASEQHKASASVKPMRQGKRPGRRASRFEMNPNSKWACDQMTVSAEPIWRGTSTVKFPFTIRNEGTAVLQIRAKGG